MSDTPKLVSIDQVESNRRRGGDVRTILSPKTVGSTSGFSGAVRLLPGEKVAEHYHPYSEEFLFLVRGSLVVDLDDEPTAMTEGDGLFIPIGVRHRLRNVSGGEVFATFHLGPLAPRPELGHVDTEEAEQPAACQTIPAGPLAGPGQRHGG
jgi:putative monooxygenase